MTLNDGFEPLRPNGNQRYRSGLPDQIGPEEFQRLLMEGRIVDGRMGGMLLGKALGDGPTRAIFKIGSDYLIQGAIEGGSFIMNRDASLNHQKRLKRMNAGLTMKEVVVVDPKDQCGQLIVCTGWPHDRLLWLEFCQTVVKAAPAMKHVIELERLNMTPNRFLACDHYEIFKCEPGTADGIV